MNKIGNKKVGDLLNFKRGYDLPESQRTAGEYPVVSSAGISGTHDEFKVEGPGVITGRYGTLGKMHYVSGRYWPHNTALYIQDFKGNDPKYLFYLLSCLGRMKTSDKSAVPGVNRNELHDLIVPAIDDRNEQKRITQILELIDLKIEINNQTKAELEKLVKTHYDYWFVQFDFPNENGQPYKTSGGRMKFDKRLKREIPNDWSVADIDSALKTSLGGTPATNDQSYWAGGSVPWLSSGEIAKFPIVDSDECITQAGITASAAELLPKGSVVISIVRHIRVSILAIDAATNQSVVGIFETNQLKRFFIYPFLCREVPRLLSIRTGAQQPHVNKDAIDRTLMTVPNDDILKKYYKMVSPAFENIDVIALENMELIKLRDWLLPMLMNGQITIQ